jgi:hypothetical protein
MIFVIVPLGEEAKDKLYWVVRVIMYTAGSMVGASLLALLLGFAGQGIRALIPGMSLGWVVAFLGVVALVFALQELGVIKLPMPQIGWQVPKSWQKSSRLTGNTLYGIVLGAGIFTYIPFASFYLLLMWEMAAGAVSLQSAVLLGMVYGLFRGIPAVVGGVSMLRGVYPIPVTNWLLDHLNWWHVVNGLALIVVGSFLLGSFVL